MITMSVPRIPEDRSRHTVLFEILAKPVVKSAHVGAVASLA